MNTIRRYRPGFFDGFKEEDITVEFTTLDDLMAIPWVKRFADARDFHCFSQSGHRLMAECQAGRQWFVIGLLSVPVEGIPPWPSRS